MGFKVLSTSNSFGIINKAPYKKLLENGCEVILNDTGRTFSREELITLGQDADAVIVGHDHITPDIVRDLEHVKIYAKNGVGYDNIDLETTRKRNIFVTNVPGSNSNEVADLVFGLMLSIARNIPKKDRELKEGIWDRGRGLSLYKKNIGIIGTGDIGVSVARRAFGFSMNVLAYDLFKSSEIEANGGVYVELEELLEKSDFVTLHLPSNEKTQNIINKQTLNLMKHNAILINTGRAELVDIDALNIALQENKIYGFGSDVFHEEPPPIYNYFNKDNVVITPHIGAATIDGNLNMGNGAVESVLAVKNGQRPPEDYIRNNL